MEFSDLIIVRCHGHRGVQVPSPVTIQCINKFQFNCVSCTVLNKKTESIADSLQNRQDKPYRPHCHPFGCRDEL